jgi:hypothetical protein
LLPVPTPAFPCPGRNPWMITPSGAPDPDIGCLADFLVRNNGFIRG